MEMDEILARARGVAERASYDELTEGLNEALAKKRECLDDPDIAARMEALIDVFLDELLIRDDVQYAGTWRNPFPGSEAV